MNTAPFPGFTPDQELTRELERARATIERLTNELRLRTLEAERAVRAKRAFLSTISHEIRTPLNAMIGASDAMACTPLDAEQRECMDVSRRNTVRLLDLLNDILVLSELEFGRIELESKVVYPGIVIQEAIQVVADAAAAKGLFVKYTLEPEVPPRMAGDPIRLRLVLAHLLNNAVKFTQHGGVTLNVALESRSAPSKFLLRFTLIDSGIGILPEKLASVFESFTQGDSSSTRKYGGAGLGLSIARKVVEQMGGSISIQSGSNVGTTVSFTIQLSAGEEEQAAPTQVPTASIQAMEPQISKLRLLLVDDSEDSRGLILLYLKRTGCAVDVAEDGLAAVGLFRKAAYDVVLMDVEMQVMDGYTATRAIRRFENETGARPTPVLALTAHSFGEVAATGFEAGFTELLTKPIRKLELLEALARHMPDGKPTVAAPEKTRFKVRIDPSMEDLTQPYLDKRRAEIPLYRQSVDEKNFVRVSALSHNMRGTGAGYGFPVLTRLGEVIEEAAKRGNSPDIRSAVNELENFLDNIELEYGK